MEMLGLLLLLIAAFKVAGTPREAAQYPNAPITLPAPAVTGSGARLPARVSEYVFWHQTRHEGIPVHAMTGVTNCPD